MMIDALYGGAASCLFMCMNSSNEFLYNLFQPLKTHENCTSSKAQIRWNVSLLDYYKSPQKMMDILFYS